MREWGFEAWKWIAAGVLMGVLSLMMITGLGARRGTPLYRFRLSLWMLVLGLGGAGASAGCDSTGITGDPDATDRVSTETCYADMGSEPDMSTCYVPWDPGLEPMPEPVPDGSTDPSVERDDVDDTDIEEDDLDDLDDA